MCYNSWRHTLKIRLSLKFQGETIIRTYQATISAAAAFNPRQLTIHFDGQRLLAAIGRYSYTFAHGVTEGWSECSTWNLPIVPGQDRSLPVLQEFAQVL